jgi:adenine-specific DNA-methyltransferase
MMGNLNKLELTWIGKESKVNIEPRILINDEKNDFGINKDENILIHGDNLLALKALESEFTGKVKSIYIDPPYNTGNAFEHYDDNIEHSIWLNLMRPRLEILKNLLSENGFIFIQIDDNEMAYLTVLMDEIFGRKNRVNIIAVKMSESSGVKMAHVEKRLPKMKEFILLYKKSDNAKLNPVKVPKSDQLDNYLKYYSKIIFNYEDNVENWIINDLKTFFLQNNIEYSQDIIRDFKIKNAHRMVYRTNNKSFEKLNIDKKIAEVISPQNIKYIWWEGKQMLFLSDYIEEYVCDLWLDISTINLNKEGFVEFNKSKKPEKLIQRCFELTTNPGDIVLDSFLGSGTTSAVAHKMGRRWIGIEMGEHAYTHCKVRLDKVIDGTDQGGISKAVNWKGGGGYRFYELAPTLIKKDSFGQEIINPEYNPEMLASAVAKHEGYVFNPHENIYWKQSKTNENSYLFVTTRHLSRELVESISQSMSEGEYLLIVCRSYDATAEKSFKNIKVKKIPQSLLKNCEFDVDNYNLNIVNPPVYQEDVMEDDYTFEGGIENE